MKVDMYISCTPILDWPNSIMDSPRSIRHCPTIFIYSVYYFQSSGSSSFEQMKKKLSATNALNEPKLLSAQGITPSITVSYLINRKTYIMEDVMSLETDQDIFTKTSWH